MDNQPKQEIAENSSGIQAHGNITIDNIGIKGDTLLPVLINFGSDISAVRTMVGEIREHQRSENLRIHLTNLQARMQSVDQINTSTSNQHLRTSKETELVEKWMDEVSNIDPEEKLLSEIWHTWMLNLAAGKDSSELGLIFEIMKKLTPAHGQLLLALKNNEAFSRRQKHSSLKFAYLKELETLGAITISRSLSRYALLLAASFVLIIATSIYLSNFLFSGASLLGGIFPMVIVGSAIIAILTTIGSPEIYSNILITNYKLTEIGERIVSFASTEINQDKPG